MWRALGRYDEDSIGYGGNKEEFTRRPIGLCRDGRAEIRVLTSVLALHHLTPPTRSAELAHRCVRATHATSVHASASIEGGAQWWQRAVAAGATALAALPGELGYADSGVELGSASAPLR